MMIGNYPNPTVHIPPWTFPDDPTVEISSPISGNADDYYPFDTLHGYLPSNDDVLDSEGSGRDSDLVPLEAYSCEQFRMYEFKVRKCTRGRSHDWTECPFAHPGEKARRRDPRKYHYSGTGCPEYRKGICKKGDNCEFAHGVFECWLHPSRYRTQPCKDGLSCQRRVCFFAHSRDQLRVLSPSSPNWTESYDGSPQRLALEASFFKTLPFLASPDSGSSPTDSPPMTNSLSRSVGLNSVNEVVASLRQLQLSKVKSSPSSWGLGLNLGSPRMSMTLTRPVFSSLPSTPSGIGSVDIWEKGGYEEEEPVMERVESGRDLRAKLFEKLSRENPLDRADPERCPITSSDVDVGWVSELV